jgi:protoporphyrinogen oxidase
MDWAAIAAERVSLFRNRKKNMEKSMIIVGAGIAGISAGCYARMNGYKTTILEMHSIPGGLCTAWKRKGFTFDISTTTRWSASRAAKKA